MGRTSHMDESKVVIQMKDIVKKFGDFTAIFISSGARSCFAIRSSRHSFTASRKIIPHQHPCQNKSHNGIDHGRRKCSDKTYIKSRQNPGPCDHFKKLPKSKSGKARPYMLLSAPMVVVAVLLLFMTPTGKSDAVQMIWIAVSYNLYYALAYPCFYTAHSSMVALSTRDSSQRGMLATFSNAAMVASEFPGFPRKVV